MKSRIFIAVFIVGIIVFAVFSANRKKTFESAEDFPRDALVFVQIADLPQFIKVWNESEFKEKYTNSANFVDFQNSHLGRKLQSRLEEFTTAGEFLLDSEMFSALSENRASFALYDIGKLEFVFIAPVSDEFFAAGKFMQNSSNFTEEDFEDGTKIFRAKVEADRGRQKQELIFTHLKGRFILTTSEKLMLETMKNINGKDAKNRLADEPLFTGLSQKIEPHLTTVWVNQTRLNADYYFKRYWLMANAENLQSIRAGIFDFEMREDKFIERRKFLLTKTVDVSPISAPQAENLLKYLPENIPFYRLEKADSKNVQMIIEKTLFERRNQETKQKKYRFDNFSFDYYDIFSSGNYEYLSGSFDAKIDETEEIEEFEKNETAIDFSNVFQAANPQAVLSLTKPSVGEIPIFVDFQNAAIFYLGNSKSFNQSRFEAEIARKFADKMLVSAPDVSFNWETKNENNLTWRELKLPMLDWKAVYSIRGNILILANNTDLLHKIFSAENNQKIDFSVSRLTSLNLSEKENAFTKIFARMEEKKAANDFFTRNIGSLLDSFSEIKKIEIRQYVSRNILEEELIFFR